MVNMRAIGVTAGIYMDRLVFLFEGRGLGVFALGHYLVEEVDWHFAEGGEGVDDGLFFFDLFVDEPLEATERGEVTFVAGEEGEVIDHFRDVFFVGEGVVEHFEDVVPFVRDGLDGAEFYFCAAGVHVFLEDAGVVLLFEPLDEEPVGDALEGFVLCVEGHCEVQVGGEELCVDLLVEGVLHFI